jgi:hypothetical protein
MARLRGAQRLRLHAAVFGDQDFPVNHLSL